MQLRKPEQYKADPGRSIPKEEWPAIAPTVTPVEKIKSRTCKVEATNDKWRLGRK